MRNKKNDIINKLDNLFKDKLQDRSFEFKEEYWTEAEERIKEYEDTLRPQSKRRGFLWLWGCILILACGTLLLLHPFSGKNETADNSLIENHAENKTSETNKLNAGDESVLMKSDSVKLHLKNEPLRSQPEQDNLIGNRNNSTGNITILNPQNDTPAHEGQAREMKSDESGLQSEVSSAGQNSQEKIISENENINEKEGSSGLLTEDRELLNKEENPISAEANLPSENNNILTDESDYSSPDNDHDTLSAPLSSLQNNSQDSTQKNEMNDTTALVDSIPVIQNDGPLSDADYEKKIRWHAGVNFGFDYITKKISPVTGSNFNTGFIAKRQTEESPIVTFSGGFTAGIDLHKFNISTGFQSYKFGEKVNYLFNNSYPETTYSQITDTSYLLIIDTIVIVDSITIIEYDTIPVYTDSLISSIQYHDSVTYLTDTSLLSYFEIPLLFGYEFTKNKWHFNFVTGPSIGIYRFAAGNTLGDQLDVQQLDSLDIFSKTTFNWILAPSVGYSINKNLDIQLQPTMRWNINSAVVKPDYKLKYSSYGLHVGLWYRF